MKFDMLYIKVLFLIRAD